jgi:hypothetical protein
MSGIKSNYIKDYLSGIDFNSTDWTVEGIKNELKKILGEYPAVEVGYKKDVAINETTGNAMEIHAVNRFTVIFTNDNSEYEKIEIKI